MNVKCRTLGILLILGLASVSSWSLAAAKVKDSGLQYPSTKDFSFGYWLNGWRKSPEDTSPDILCFESGYYGFMLDVADLTKARFGLINDDIDYRQALKSGKQRLSALPSAELTIALKVNDRVYLAVSCAAGTSRKVRRLQDARMWESGRLVQHFDLLDLKFEDEEGNSPGCFGTLDLLAWPDSLTLTAEVAAPAAWNDAELSVSLKSGPLACREQKRVIGTWKQGERQHVTLTYDMRKGLRPDEQVVVRVATPDKQTFPVTFEKKKNCMVVRVRNLKRAWKRGYRDIRNYDEFDIAVENRGGKGRTVPFLLDFTRVANVTGLCPILCDEDGVPTGIPVQLSKNWHNLEIGAYLRAYALLPAPPGKSVYRLRIAYGFYGTLPSASHAQLSLVGYGGNGRWDQLAIGCWGETFCLNMDMSCREFAITDVRALMLRNGLDGEKWNWTDAAWGGDWLGVNDAEGHKLTFSGLKTAYMAHGPCMTEARYHGFYGSHREVGLRATVRTLRTDDYARTFHTIDYTFGDELAIAQGWLFKMGGGRLLTPRIAYGNGAGVIAQHEVPRRLKRGELFVDKVPLSGDGPWWIAFPGSTPLGRGDWGTGSRALIIRSYLGSFGGKAVEAPTISMPVHRVQADGRLDLNLLLVPPPGVGGFKPGDQLAMDLEWVTLPRTADDYYGPNEAFRKHLADNPRSWKTVYREAAGNDLKVKVTGGTVLKRYPIIVQAEADNMTVEIEGGVGFAPIRFEGLRSATEYTLQQRVGDKLISLDQSVHGNDFWQTDYDPRTSTYKMSFNLPLDGKEASTWVLERR